MPKNIIFCADGTWNGPGKDDDDTSPASNVWKLFMQLDGTLDPATLPLANEQEKTLAGDGGHAAKYIHGVGDSSVLLDRVFGGMFGSGIIERIVRGYTFISRNYEDGDSIYIVGFSRGAYTARALGGLITDMGLLNNAGNRLDDKAMAYRLGAAVWRAHRDKRVQARAANTGNNGLVALFKSVVDALPHFISTPLGPNDVIATRNHIRAIAVWDTVGALGIPLYADSDDRMDVFRFADTALSQNVDFGIHAISLDEQRADFTPTLWDARSGVTQVLFPGAHADVGGGYPPNETGLSNGALVWMVAKLSDLGVKFHGAPALTSGNADSIGHRPWATGVFTSLKQGPRTVLETAHGTDQLGFHQSISMRLQASPTTWLPDNNTTQYAPTVLASVIAANTQWEKP